MPLQDLREEKNRLRQIFLQRRAALSSEAQAAAGQAVTRELLRLREWAPEIAVGFYWAIRGELPTGECLRQLQEKGCRAYFPRFCGQEPRIEFAPVEAEAHLVDGPFGIRQPAQDLAALELARIQVLLIPGAVFDVQGNRIGWGKGYYDRILKDFKGKRIALGYDFQVLPSIPATPEDEKVDLIVTEQRVVECPGHT